MRNQALIAKSSELNEFTIELKRRCQLHGHVVCETRYGEIFKVKYTPANIENGQWNEMFDSVNTAHCWNADGSSIQSRDYDLFEFEGEPLLKKEYNIVEELLKQENIKYKVITDLPTLMIYTRGKINPAQAIGFAPDGFGPLILFNVYQAISFINQNGLRQI